MNINVFGAKTNHIYTVTGTVVCDCGNEYTGTFEAKMEDETKVITGKDGVGRLFRLASYAGKPSGMCNCVDTVWIADDNLLADVS